MTDDPRRDVAAGQAQREMTLEEWVHRLPESHQARREYEALTTSRQGAVEQLGRYTCDACDHPGCEAMREAADLLREPSEGREPDGWCVVYAPPETVAVPDVPLFFHEDDARRWIAEASKVGLFAVRPVYFGTPSDSPAGEADSKRLDWLEGGRRKEVHHNADGWLIHSPVRGVLSGESNHATLREAIDAAMVAEPAESEEHEWIYPTPSHSSPWPYCRVCGFVKRRDGKNKPCRGPVKVELRGAAPSPEGVEPTVEELADEVGRLVGLMVRRYRLARTPTEPGEADTQTTRQGEQL